MNTLLIGPPGSGKTTAACTAEPPILLLDIDGKANQMISLQPLIKSGDLVIREMENKLISDRLRYRAKHPDKGPQEEPQGYYEIVDILNDIIEGFEEYMHYKTIILDSFTRTVEHLKRLLNFHKASGKFGSQKKITEDMNWPSWGSYLSLLEELCTVFTTHVQQNFVCCAHQSTETEKDLNDNIIVNAYWPMVDGQMKQKLGGYFNEVYFMNLVFAKNKPTKYQFMTHPDNKHNARTSMDLEQYVPADLQFRQLEEED